MLWQSEDGVTFGDPVHGYFNAGHYLQNVKTLPGSLPANEGKLVRPQILMIDGEPAWLYAPLWEKVTGHKFTQSHSFRILSDKEVLERRKKRMKDQESE